MQALLPDLALSASLQVSETKVDRPGPGITIKADSSHARLGLNTACAATTTTTATKLTAGFEPLTSQSKSRASTARPRRHQVHGTEDSVLDFMRHGRAQEDETHSGGNPRWLMG
ncbi:hypothetical protein ElyMa_006513800 [Elysia marginata]|uniref:Uncharacterized protein n=1 Tax=Elysia marginata TaxID=1093978 RepID=A0AAV4I6A1_9GAST|nr:hypothetical protein ElyMa_006513800 [Elysia marginata]